MTKGIAGAVYPDVFQVKPLIHPMLEALAYRNPKGSDLYSFKNVQIGMRGGKIAAPAKKQIFVALDGTLDNPEELRQEIGRLDSSFHLPISDGELIARAYAAFGTACLERLNGAFAFALYDQAQEILLLARDRIGKKPLYWSDGSHGFFFASELKALLVTGCIAQTPALEALASYLYFGYIPQDLTPIQNVNRLLPGHFLLLKRTRTLMINPYWSYSSFFQKEHALSPATTLKILEELIDTSVEREISETEGAYGCYLAGGLGSTTIASRLQQQAVSFSVGFKGQNEADIRAARTVAEQFKMAHEEEWISKENFSQDLVKIAWHLDEPLADPQIVATWQLAKLAKATVSTLFSGMGSDELLAGHTRYTKKVLAHSWSEKPLQFLRHLFIPILQSLQFRASYTLLRQSRLDPWQFAFLRQNALFSESLMQSAAPKLASFFDAEVFLAKFHNLERVTKPVSALLYFDIKTRLPDCFMLQFERLTAAHGLDWKAPFLSRALVEFAAGIPLEKNGEAWLKLLLEGSVSSDILNRPKLSRPHFLQSWGPELKELFQLLLRGVLVESGFVSAAWIKRQIQSQESLQSHFRHLFALLMLEIWFRLYIDGPIQTHPPTLSVKELLT